MMTDNYEEINTLYVLNVALFILLCGDHYLLRKPQLTISTKNFIAGETLGYQVQSNALPIRLTHDDNYNDNGDDNDEGDDDENNTS